MHNTEHEILLNQINHAAWSDLDVAKELVKYIPIARETAVAMKAERKLNNDLSDKSLNWMVEAFDLDHESGTKYALKMALRNFRSETL